jgi:hypothetical protein
MNSKLVSTTLLSNATSVGGSLSSSASATTPVNSQFRHTIMWNGIIAHLKARLIETNKPHHTRLRKHPSRFASASMGGMLLIKHSVTVSSSVDISLDKQGNETTPIYFNGSHCVDIVYDYLIANQHTLQFERQITREKCVKVSGQCIASSRKYLDKFWPKKEENFHHLYYSLGYSCAK